LRLECVIRDCQVALRDQLVRIDFTAPEVPVAIDVEGSWRDVGRGDWRCFQGLPCDALKLSHAEQVRIRAEDIKCRYVQQVVRLHAEINIEISAASIELTSHGEVNMAKDLVDFHIGVVYGNSRLDLIEIFTGSRPDAGAILTLQSVIFP